ncbi:hypothetical protein [Streptomyces sp. NBRC 109706]|uniref:hypothetical protein n=1 Tax=Streptomyces sp. NBRC 109706 TaxID=1550035 RepID=UPI0007835C95|nr:hypothetical protein [Streptomyces sp. NBRC 109706]
MTRIRIPLLAIITAAALALTACSDDDAEPTRAGDRTAPPSGEAVTEDPATEEEPAPVDEPQTAPGMPDDLAWGDTHNWNDGVSLTIAGVTQVPDADLGEFDREFMTDGHTPLAVQVAITNDGEAPLDLMEFSFLVNGATTGGEAESLFLEGDVFLEGRLAPGQTRDYTDHVSFDIGEYGSDITVEAMRFYDGMDFDHPIWVGTIQ